MISIRPCSIDASFLFLVGPFQPVLTCIANNISSSPYAYCGSLNIEWVPAYNEVLHSHAGRNGESGGYTAAPDTKAIEGEAALIDSVASLLGIYW